MNKNYSSHEINHALIEFEIWQDDHDGDLEDFITQCEIEKTIADGLRRTIEFENRLRDMATDEGEDRKHLLSGRVIGNYRFVRRLGVGGMGTVWLAEQLTPVHREVAIKLIRPGLDSEHFEKRFEAEQQALAMMSHPHVAKVLNAGKLEDGRPYFVMDFVPGLAITEYCNENRLSLQSRLKLFLQLCDAVQHAHQKGLIHRDIKPTNVLITDVDGKPHVKVIDFGLVKDFSHDAHLTQVAMPLGSPLWMSPEQALGRQADVADIDTRTDIYSLGVILYQLLTNSTPITADFFDTAGPLEILEAIQKTDPPYPSIRLSDIADSNEWLELATTSNLSSWSQMLRNDLDWVTMKALEKDRERRYASVSALSDDVERFLDDEPVVARPPTFGYRLNKSMKKHRVIAMATIATATSLMLATLISILFAFWATNEREAAERERNLLECVVDVITGSLGSLNESGTTHSRETDTFLLALIKETDQRDFKNDPLTEANLRFTIGKGLARSGMDEYAIKEFKKVLAINEGSPTNNVELHVDAGTRLSLALSRTEQFKAAERIAILGIDLADEELDAGHRLGVKAEIALNTARIHRQEFDLAIRELARLQTLVQTQFGKADQLMIDIKIQLAKAKSGVSEFSTAVWYLEEARELATAKLGEDNPISRKLFVDIWQANAFNIQLEQSPDRLRKYLEATEKDSLGTYSIGHPVMLSLRDRCGDILYNNNHPLHALDVYSDNLRICRENRGKNHQNAAHCLSKIGLIQAQLGEFEKAIRSIEEANAITNKNHGNESYESMWGQYDLGLVYLMKKDVTLANNIADSVLKNPVLIKESRLSQKLEVLKEDCEIAGSTTGTIVHLVESFLEKLPNSPDAGDPILQTNER